MGYESFSNTNGVMLSDSAAREYVKLLFDYYNIKKKENKLYDAHDTTALNIISLYVNYIKKRDFNLIYQDYKNNFIVNESVVEPGVIAEERVGLGFVYDYIKSFNDSKGVNIFIESFKIHNLLYSACPYPEFGSKLRSDSAMLYDTPYEVVSSSVVIREFNKYVTKVVKYSPDIEIFNYIDSCIKLVVDLIKLQPFADGNKRTFRAVLNLLLKQAGIPPIYIKQEEREVYKKELLKAICNDDYEGMYRFYYYKIADSIVSLDIYGDDNDVIYIHSK